jgi:hypothetical protein
VLKYNVKTYYSFVDRLAGKDAGQYADQNDDIASERSADDHQLMERAASGLTVVMKRQAHNGKCLQNIHTKIVTKMYGESFRRRKIRLRVSTLQISRSFQHREKKTKNKKTTD